MINGGPRFGVGCDGLWFELNGPYNKSRFNGVFVKDVQVCG